MVSHISATLLHKQSHQTVLLRYISSLEYLGLDDMALVVSYYYGTVIHGIPLGKYQELSLLVEASVLVVEGFRPCWMDQSS